MSMFTSTLRAGWAVSESQKAAIVRDWERCWAGGNPNTLCYEFFITDVDDEFGVRLKPLDQWAPPVPHA